MGSGKPSSGGGVGGWKAPGDTEDRGGPPAGYGGADQGQVHVLVPHRRLLLGSKGKRSRNP